MNAIKKGLIHPSLISLIFTIIMILVLLPWRANLHAAFNKAALHFGINLNNIASDNYVAWIKNQPQDFHKDNLAIFLNKDLANAILSFHPFSSLLTRKPWADRFFFISVSIGVKNKNPHQRIMKSDFMLHPKFRILRGFCQNFS